jgi:hypothetical protein
MLALAAPCAAQDGAFGLGARLAMVKNDAPVDTDSQRFTGGQIRLRMSPKMALEVSLDRRSETFDALDEKVVDYPLQTSLLLYPVRAAVSPYVLGGPGWYTHKVEALSDADIESETSRRFGWHAGFGAEIRMGKHAGLHGDYRYTFLKFGDDDDDESVAASPTHSFVSSLLPSSGGSMWTVGLTIYF